MTAPYSEHDPHTGTPGGAPSRRVRPGQVAGGLLILLALVFIFENTKTVEVRLIFPQVRAPLFVALLIAALLGAMAALLLQLRRQRKQ